MRERPRQERSGRAPIRRAIAIVAFTVLSAAALVLIGNKMRTTWGVLNTIERRVDGMIASGTEPGGPMTSGPRHSAV